MSKIPFRVSDGLDGANKRAINIGYPNITTLTDGVNIQYFIDENTVQQYDETRKYKKNFAVLFNDRLYYAKRDVPVDGAASAGVFNETHWQQLRTDPNWTNITSTPPGGQELTVGMFVSADPTYSDLDFILPRSPQNGDTVVIKDVSGKVSTMKLAIRTTDKILDNGKAEYQITFPKATLWLSYDTAMDLGKGGWRINATNSQLDAKTIAPTAQATQLSNGDTIFRRSAAGKIVFQLPLYANDGDSISTFDLDRMTPLNNLTIKVHPKSEASVLKAGQKEAVYKTTDWGRFVYNASQMLWEIWDGDEHERWTKIPATATASNVSLVPNTSVSVTGPSGSVNFTLPPAPEPGDIIRLSLRNASKGVNISVKPATGDKIHAETSMLGLVRFEEIKSYDKITSVTELKFQAKGRGEQFTFTYAGDEKAWVIVEQSSIDILASANSATRTEPGLVYFANEAEVMKNSEQNPSDEQAVTPLLLSKKTATTSRRGIAYIASGDEVNAGSNTDKIVTPKTLNDRVSTEGRTGIAAIATQDETNAGTNDTKFVTPKKLNNRTATDSRTGIIKLMSLKGTAQTARDKAGTGINDFNEHTKAITAKTLFEKTASETNLGLVWQATQTEVNGGASGNIFVTPLTLQSRTATETRTGLARMVDMTKSEHLKDINGSIHDNVFITPKALASRTADYTQTGITRYAVNAEVSAGTDDFYAIGPAKLKYFAESVFKMTAPDADGLSATGNLWSGLTFKIGSPTETARGTARFATQDETNAGTLDSVILTPRKLNGRTATTGRTGIIRLATASEAAAGVLDNVAITPSTMGSVISESPEWGSTEARRGSVYTGSLTNDSSASTVWQGDDINGSTRVLANYKHESYSVSPRGLNTALQHYLPIKAKAVNSNQLDGRTADKYMRTDIDTSTVGNLSTNKLLSAVMGKFNGVNSSMYNSQGTYIGWNKVSGQGRTDFINNRGNGPGGFSFWHGQNTYDDLKEIVNISPAGQINAYSLVTNQDIYVKGKIDVDGEINYKKQTLDARFVNAAGDNVTGDLNFSASARINFDENTTYDGKPNYLIMGKCGLNDYGYFAVGATASNAGFLDIGTRDDGNEPIYIRQRASGDVIKNEAVLLDENGNTKFPKQIAANNIILTGSTGNVIQWGNAGAKVGNDGNIYGTMWGNGTAKWLDVYLKETFNTKVNRAGDTITGSLTVKKDVIVEGDFKIKVGSKYLVIRPNADNETVSFDWE